MSYKKRRHFLLISLVVLLSYAALFCGNHCFSKKNFHVQNEFAQASFETTYRVIYDQMCNTMLHMSLLIASQDEVQRLMFIAANTEKRDASESERVDADVSRKELLRNFGKEWDELKAVSNLRIFHFHIGPGATSFLRVHAPEKHGDHLDDVRHTVVAVNTEQKPAVGFETGRLWSGLRGVAPIFAKDPATGKTVHVGAVETGTSLDDLLDIIRSFSDADAAVFLTESHARHCMWPSHYEEMRSKYTNIPGFIVEATTTPDFHQILSPNEMFLLQQEQRIPIKKIDNRYYRIMSVPLRDYQGSRDPLLPDVGIIVAWKDISESYHILNNSIKRTLLIGAIAFLITEILLWWGISAITNRLENLIESSRKDLKQKNRELEDLNHHILSQNEALEASKKERDEFIGIATHDLKNPLSAIISSTDLLTADPMPTKQEKEDLLNFIKASCSQMLDIIGKLLRINQFDQNSVVPSLNPINIEKLISDELSMQYQYANSKNIEIIRSNAKTDLVHSDENAVHEIFNNLLSNAIKYSPKGKRIWVESGQDASSVWFTVKDEGPGFTEEDKKQLYQKFAKLSAQPTGGETLTGLGLSIVKHYVTLIKGTIELESSPGKGSAFTVNLPLNVQAT